MLSWLKGKRPSQETPSVDIAAMIRDALEKQQRGDVLAARALYEQVIAHDDQHADALYLLGLTYADEKKYSQAFSFVSRAIRSNPIIAAFYQSCGDIHCALGDSEKGIASYRQAIQLEPSNVDALNALAVALFQTDRTEESVSLLKEATQIAPNDARSFYHLGMALARQQVFTEALSAYERASQLAPNNFDVLTSLGVVAHALGSLERACSSFERALTLQPQSATAQNNLGTVLHSMERTEEAISYFRAALKLDPTHALALGNLAQALQEIGFYREALLAFDRRIAQDPSAARKMRKALALPVIPQSTDEIDEARNNTEVGLEELLASDNKIETPERDVATCNFSLAYHGRNDRLLQMKTAQTYVHLCPSLDWTAPNVDRMRNQTGRIRVGFISRFLRQHSIGKTSRGLIAKLNRNEFEVFAIHTAPMANDFIGQFIREHAEHSLVVSNNLQQARETIAALELDVLFYQDIGMDPFTYYLAYSRLAPTQCVSFGHPDTTGIPNMDWWISSENFEPEDAKEHYSENLWLAKDVGTLAYYYRPEMPARFKSREQLGVDSDRHMYFCPHTPFRIAPDFDQVLAKILALDPNGDVWLIEGKRPPWTQLLKQRLNSSLGELAHRIKVLPLQPHATYLNLMHAADAVLDPIWFNGMNNSLDAFSVGVPVVTLPHLFQRGRHAFGMYKKLNWFDCVAKDTDEYAAIALRLACDLDFQKYARSNVVERRDDLFEDERVVEEFARFFHQVTGR